MSNESEILKLRLTEAQCLAAEVVAENRRLKFLLKECTECLSGEKREQLVKLIKDMGIG